MLPLGWVTSPTPSISSLLLPTLLFVCLWAHHVPEPALISIPHNTVYLLRYRQKGEGGENESESQGGKGERDRESWEEGERGLVTGREGEMIQRIKEL